MAGQQPVFVMNSAPERQSGRKAQLSNISAAKVSRGEGEGERGGGGAAGDDSDDFDFDFDGSDNGDGG